MSQSTSDVALWMVGIVFGGLVLLSPAACSMHRQYRIQQAITAGSDPIAVKCALEGAFDDSRTLCLAYVMNRATK